MSGRSESHVPIRSCICCRQKFPKSMLNRFVLRGNLIQPDPSHRLPGRGAYLCNFPACWKKAQQTGLFRRAFRVQPMIFDYSEYLRFYEFHIHTTETPECD
ncbi:MAG: YlxR family protein [Gemmatimonadetes bacterium]|nr:MAG: YlxR family protein [Gemmatimonadota bacterium]